MMNRRANIKNLFGTLLTLGLVAITSLGFTSNALAAEATTGAAITQNTKMEVMVPMKVSDIPNLKTGQSIYIDSLDPSNNKHIATGDLSINASAYSTALITEADKGNQFSSAISRPYAGYSESITNKVFVKNVESAAGFDGCPAGIIYTEDNGSSWKYSCCYGGVQGLSVIPFIGSSVNSKVTVTMKDTEYTLDIGETKTITENDIEKVEYEYTFGDNVVKEELPKTSIQISDGVIKQGDTQIVIKYGVGGSVTVALPLTYEVEFDFGNGQKETQHVKHGGFITAPTTIPEKEGFVFKYWSTTPGGEEFNFETTPVKDVTIFYPVWAAGSKSISATVDENSKGTISAAGINNDATTLSEALLTEEEKSQVGQGVNSNIFLTVEDIQDKLTEEQKAKVAEGLTNDSSIAVVLDLNLFKKIGNNDPVKIANTQGNMVSITLTLDDKYINNNPGLERTYEIIRVHETGEGTEISVLPAAFDPVTKTITFETDRFSLYAISLTDKAVAPTTKSPKTGDGLNLPLIIMMMALSMLVITSAMFVRTKKCDK